MRICIDIPGSTRDGLWSAERGESRWAQEWARALAEAGHSVDCICSHAQWGACPPVKNVVLRERPDRGTVYDVFMHACWWEGRDIDGVRARLYVHHHWGFSEWLKKESHIGKNHVITYPYVQAAKNFIGPHNPFSFKTFCLPIPLGKEFGPSHFDKKELTFSAKDVFLDRYYPNNTNWFRCGKSVIETIRDLNSEFGYTCNFMMWEQLSASNKYVVEYGVDKIIGSIANKRQFFQMPSQHVKDVLENTKMSFPVISCGGSQIEGVMLGVLPLTWEGGVFDVPAKKYDFLLNERSPEKDIKEHINRAVRDKGFYEILLADFQKELTAHLTDNALAHFKTMTDWMEKNC